MQLGYIDADSRNSMENQKLSLHLVPICCTRHETNKLDLGEIYVVLNFQGFAICATGVTCKILNDKKNEKNYRNIK